MSRFEQRLRQDLQNPEFAAGYYEQDVEIKLMRALDAYRRHEQMTTTQLAQLSGLSRETVSRLFHADEPNPTLETFSRLLRALHLQAEVTIRRAPTGEPPIRIKEAAETA